jgi:putative DNA primase/helicase
VFTQETEGSKRLSESKIKMMTGGDKLTARFMRQDDFEFQPKFKIIMAGNHKPGLQDVGEAMRRRVHIVPWAVTIPPDERDHALDAKLVPEHGGILRWMIDGCLAWRHGGLNPPASVLAATDEYMEAEDALAGWMEECCILDPTLSTSIGLVYPDYVAYCEKSKEHAWSKKRLLQNLYARDGLSADREYGIRVVKGMGLKDGESQVGML